MSSTVESALHSCVVLAALPKGASLPAQRLADFHELPPASLAKQMQQLMRAGVVSGSTGRHGGYRLARSPQSISILEIVNAVDGDSGFRCEEIRRQGPCTGPDRDYTPTCAIARLMGDAEAAWKAVLAASSLADVGRAIVDDLDPRTISETAVWLTDNRRQDP